MRYAAFMLLTATPAWLSLAESARERIVADELHPIFARHQDSVRATYYDTEAYSAKPSDVLLLEYDSSHAHAALIDALRSCPLIAQGYFEIEQLIVGERASWLDPSSPPSAGAPGCADGATSMSHGHDLYKLSALLYAFCMSTIDVSEARQRLSAVIDRAETEAVTLVRYGRPAAVVLSPARYEELLAAAEDAEDVAAFDEAMAEEGPNIPWDQVKADLGWA